MKEHRWSGWPGAWCLDCGQDCKLEFLEENGGDYKSDAEELKHLTDECPEPGSQRHDPYAKRENR